MIPPADYHPEMGTTSAERMRELRRKRADAGLQQVIVWVPVSKAERLRRYAEQLRSEPPEATD